MTSENTFYKIRTDKFGTLYAAHAQTDPSELNNITHGDSLSIRLFFPQEQLTVANGETYTVESNTTEVYNTADVNGTLDVDGTLIVYDNIDTDGTTNVSGTLIVTNGQFPEIQSYDRHAGSYATIETLNNTQNYRLQIPSNANVNTLLIGLEPNSNMSDVDGQWGLVANVTDSRTRPLTNYVIELEVQILAQLSEYADLSTAETNLEV
jgi:hypothetical protein